jgi:hypothetical protein
MAGRLIPCLVLAAMIGGIWIFLPMLFLPLLASAAILLELAHRAPTLGPHEHD